MDCPIPYGDHNNSHHKVLVNLQASNMDALKNHKSSTVAEMGDRGHNRHGRKEGGCCAPFADSWDHV